MNYANSAEEIKRILLEESLIPVAIANPDKAKERKEAPYGRCICGHPFNSAGGCGLCHG